MWPFGNKSRTLQASPYTSPYFLRSSEKLGLLSTQKHLDNNCITAGCSHRPKKFTRTSQLQKGTLTWSLYRRLRSVFMSIVPVVHADSGSSEKKSRKQQAEEVAALPLDAVTDEEVKRYIDKETGMDRLKAYFYKDPVFEDLNPECAQLLEVWFTTMASVFILAAVVGFRRGRVDFRKEAAGAKFKTHFLAARRMNDRAMQVALKDGAFWVSRLAAYSGSVLLITQSIAVYRNKTTPFEYMVGFGVSTGVWRAASLGIKGFISGSVLGSVGGLLMGLVAWTALNYAKETTEDIHFERIRALLAQQKVDRGEAALQS